MSIDLLYVLTRNKIDLQTFILKNNLLNYDIFLKYCEGRKFVPCSKELYDEAISKNDKIKQQKQKKATISTSPRKKREITKKETTRKTSTPPKPKRRRTSTKKQSKS